jgi:hypothetical protein
VGGESRGESEKSRRRGGEAVQKCKSAGGLCKGGKVEPEYRGRRARRGMVKGDSAKVQISLRAVQRWKG